MTCLRGCSSNWSHEVFIKGIRERLIKIQEQITTAKPIHRQNPSQPKKQSKIYSTKTMIHSQVIVG